MGFEPTNRHSRQFKRVRANVNSGVEAMQKLKLTNTVSKLEGVQKQSYTKEYNSTVVLIDSFFEKEPKVNEEAKLRGEHKEPFANLQKAIHIDEVVSSHAEAM